MSLPYLTVGSTFLREGERRLDANYYNLALKARWELECSKWPLKPLGTMSSLFYPGRFKRPYVEKGNGVPFVGSREMFFWPLSPKDFLQGKPEDWDELMVDPGWILVSRSGTVGQVLWVDRTYKEVAVTEHAIRIKPNKETVSEFGFLYAFLRTRYGESLMLGSEFGAVVKEIEPEQIVTFPVPLLPLRFRKRIHAKMLRARTLRERGAYLLKKADRLLYDLLALPNPKSLSLDYLPNVNDTKVKAYVVKRCELEGRLDGSYHDPEVEGVLRALRRSRYTLVRLGSLAEYINIPPRFKRHYVDSKVGVPFVRPSDLATVRVLEKRYIAIWTPELDQLLMHKGEVLVSTDGSIGDLAFVTDSWDGWAGSNNIGRIKVDPKKVHPGYVLAFLASPYGQIQLKREIYGGVIDHLEVSHIKGVCIPLPPLEVQETIGDRVLMAYTLRDKANALEEEAIAELEQAISHEAKLRLIQCRNV